MKILVASDIHGSYAYLLKLIEKLAFHKADYLVILGDILYHGPRNNLPEEYDTFKVYELLNKYKEKIIAVKGNCDALIDEMVLEFPLSEVIVLHYFGHNIYAMHGHQDYKHYPMLKQNDVMMSGHTHIPLLQKEAGIIYLNPGSIAIPKNNTPHSYALLTDQNITIYGFNDQIYLQKTWSDLDA